MALRGIWSNYILIIVSAQVDMHTYQCFGDFWNAVHNDDAGKGLHYDVSCAYAYEVGGVH